MPLAKSNYEIMDLNEFQAMLNKGQFYTGLVEQLGYVYWTDEIVYFIRTNPEELFGKPRFQQIPVPYSYHNSQLVVSKVRKVMHIMPKEELRKYNFDMYFQFYGVIEKMNNYFCETDAISDYRKIGSSTKIKNISELNNIIENVNTTTGYLEEAGILSLPKWVSLVQKGVICFSIYQDVSDGNYVDAAGKILSEFNPYSTWIDIGKAIMNSDHMQFKLARLYAKDYLEAVAGHRRWSAIYDQAAKKNNYDLKRKCRKEMDHYGRIADNSYAEFKNCMDKLGIKYY